MRSVTFAVVLMCATSALAEPVITFPGEIKAAKAPNSNSKVVYFDLGENKYGLHEYNLALVHSDGRFDKLDTFTRSVDVSWSSSGDRLFVTDYIGSNVADCYVIELDRAGFEKLSLTEILVNKFTRLDHLMGIVDHSYVGCTHWLTPHTIQVIAEGHGARGHNQKIMTEFEFGFVYDAYTGSANQMSAKVTKSKL